ncbi:ferritin [Candidatus Acetothermia bacterium]|jgi:ferritin|nr:ferritin [Candidatus Acetothermia bacterium]MCI2426980.1 ferritin [Candidatus Acetothermia bacterium]MCI2428548.1 ferritin [Candidatus Acetothermia bacterium]
MISQRMQNALNEQIKHELESAYLYLSMVAYFRAEAFDGMAQWMTVQAQEEFTHAMKLFDYIDESDGRVELSALAQPPKEWTSPLEAFQAAYQHEQFITEKIDDLMKLAIEVKDHAAQIMLQWFVTEQIEEESSVRKIVNLLARVGDSGHGIVMIDRELGKRIAVPAVSKE